MFIWRPCWGLMLLLLPVFMLHTRPEHVSSSILCHRCFPPKPSTYRRRGALSFWEKLCACCSSSRMLFESQVSSTTPKHHPLCEQQSFSAHSAVFAFRWLLQFREINRGSVATSFPLPGTNRCNKQKQGQELRKKKPPNASITALSHNYDAGHPGSGCPLPLLNISIL